MPAPQLACPAAGFFPPPFLGGGFVAPPDAAPLAGAVEVGIWAVVGGVAVAVVLAGGVGCVAVGVTLPAEPDAAPVLGVVAPAAVVPVPALVVLDVVVDVLGAAAAAGGLTGCTGGGASVFDPPQPMMRALAPSAARVEAM